MNGPWPQTNFHRTLNQIIYALDNCASNDKWQPESLNYNCHVHVIWAGVESTSLWKYIRHYDNNVHLFFGQAQIVHTSDSIVVIDAYCALGQTVAVSLLYNCLDNSRVWSGREQNPHPTAHARAGVTGWWTVNWNDQCNQAISGEYRKPYWRMWTWFTPIKEKRPACQVWSGSR